MLCKDHTQKRRRRTALVLVAPGIGALVHVALVASFRSGRAGSIPSGTRAFAALVAVAVVVWTFVPIPRSTQHHAATTLVAVCISPEVAVRLLLATFTLQFTWVSVPIGLMVVIARSLTFCARVTSVRVDGLAVLAAAIIFQIRFGYVPAGIVPVVMWTRHEAGVARVLSGFVPSKAVLPAAFGVDAQQVVVRRLEGRWGETRAV